MEKINIANEKLYIKDIRNVLKTTLTNQKEIHVLSRHSDAFIFIREGSCTYTFPNDKYSITAYAGDILYLAAGAEYKMHIHTPLYSSIYCDFDFGNEKPRKSDVITPGSVSNTENLFIRIKNINKSSAAISHQRSMADLYGIYAEFTLASSAGYLAPTPRNKIKDAKLYIDSNYSNSELCVSEIAKNFAMSEVYLRKLFKAQYKISPIKYIKSVRLEKAKELLKYPFLSVEECAQQSGFLSVQYFYREFKKATGITPLQFRSN